MVILAAELGLHECDIHPDDGEIDEEEEPSLASLLCRRGCRFCMERGAFTQSEHGRGEGEGRKNALCSGVLFCEKI